MLLVDSRFGCINYALFAFDNGEMRLYEQYDDIGYLSNSYQLIRMHDNGKGAIPAVCHSFDQRFIFSIGHDGNIFMYEWRLRESATVGQASSPERQLPNSIADSIESLSLEEQKQESNRRRRQAEINEKKSMKMEQLSGFVTHFQEIKSRNNKLPQHLKLTRVQLELDERITENFQMDVEEERRQLRRTIEFDVEKTKLQLQKLTNFFIDSMEDRLLTVTGIR